MPALLCLLMLGAATAVAYGAVRICRRLGIEPMPALLWLGLAEWSFDGAPDTGWRERFEDGLVALAAGPAPAVRVRGWLVASSAAAVGAFEAASARRLDV